MNTSGFVRGKGTHRELIGVWDDPNKGYAFNVYLNYSTGTIYKEDVWKNSGVTSIDLKNNVVKLEEGND